MKNQLVMIIALLIGLFSTGCNKKKIDFKTYNEPLYIEFIDLLLDGGTYEVKLTDGNNEKLTLFIDNREGTKSPGSIAIDKYSFDDNSVWYKKGTQIHGYYSEILHNLLLRFSRGDKIFVKYPELISYKTVGEELEPIIEGRSSMVNKLVKAANLANKQ